MFINCTSLVSLDLSNLITNNAEDIGFMFYNCSSLISLNLSNFDKSFAQHIDNMFYNCYSLISLDLSNFQASDDKEMDNMFYNCSSLSYLFLSNLDSSKDLIIERIITDECYSLKFINLQTNEINNDIVDKILNSNLKNLAICSDVKNNFENFLEKEQKINCNNNFINNIVETEFKCYMENITEDY